MGENEDPLNVPSPQNERERNPQPTGWSDAQASCRPTPAKQEQNESFDMAFGLSMKLEDNGMRLGEFTQGDGLTDAEHWSRFSPRAGHLPLQGLHHNFPYNSVSTSPETSESATPPSLPDSLQSALPDPSQGALTESFQRALHGPEPDIRALHAHELDVDDADAGPMFRPFGSSRADEFWHKGLDEFGGNKSGLHLPYPSLGLGSSANSGASISSSLAANNTLPLPLPLSNAYSYPQHASYPDIFPHTFPGSGQQSVLFGPGQLSPPPTASTSSTSSGSSSPFMRGEVFEQTTQSDVFERQGTWKQYPANTNAYPSPPLRSDRFSYNPAHSHSHTGQQWHAGTCDPRGITGEQEREDFNRTRSAYGEAMIPVPSQSPALSDLSASSSSADQGEMAAKRGRGRPRRSDSGAGDHYYAETETSPKNLASGAGAGTNAGSVYKIKKKPVGPGTGEEMLGMGLEDVDERALEFTSRQDTKPTRMLRRQCFNCRTWRDVSAWRRSIMQVGHIVCNKCGLYEKAHKKSRPLNDRGEFVRPGKHASKSGAATALAAGRGRARVRATQEGGHVVGAGVMRFESDGVAK